MRSNLVEQAQFWERQFFETPPDRSLADQDWSWLVERLRKAKVKTVLDVGFGMGHWSVALARAGFQVTAVEISALAVEYLQAWAKEEGLLIEAFVCPAQGLPTDRAFDAVIANSVLDHMFKEEAEEAIRRIHTILRPGGLLLLGMDGPPNEEDEKYPHLVFPDGTWQFLGGRRDRLLWRFWTDAEIRELLQGFVVEEFWVRPDGKRHVWSRKYA